MLPSYTQNFMFLHFVKISSAPVWNIWSLWYDMVDLRALKSWRDDQLSLAQSTETKK